MEVVAKWMGFVARATATRNAVVRTNMIEIGYDLVPGADFVKNTRSSLSKDDVGRTLKLVF